MERIEEFSKEIIKVLDLNLADVQQTDELDSIFQKILDSHWDELMTWLR